MNLKKAGYCASLSLYRSASSSRASVKMPPKASSSKRKAVKDKVEDEESDYQGEDAGEQDESQKNGKKPQAAKKAKVQKEPVKPLDPSVPTNITFPINLTLPPKSEGTIRLACWNVCGINSCIKKGFDFYIKAENPDVLIVTETKVDKEVDHEVLKSRYPVRVSYPPVPHMYLTYNAPVVPGMGSRSKEGPFRNGCILQDQA